MQARRRCLAGGAVVGLLLGLLALGPGLGRGFLLSYDMVFVPHPAINAAMFGMAGGPPRAVPSDLVAAVLSLALPADIVQKLILLAVFVLAGAGAAGLLDDGQLAGGLAAGAFYAWNPFVAERLIIGQWALLLGYAGLPWVVGALTRPADGWRQWAGRLSLALIPAAIGGFAAMSISALVIVPVVLAVGTGPGRRIARAAAALGLLALMSLPWLIPSLTRPFSTSPAGITAFAARPDTPFGSVGSLLTLGGIWNAQVVPDNYGGAASGLWLAVVLAAIACYAVAGRRRWPGLSIAAAGGLAIACLALIAPGRAALVALVTFSPAFAVLRDAQQFVAPLAVVIAAGAGIGAQAMTRWLGSKSAREAAALAAVAFVAIPVVLLPGLAWGAGGRLSPVSYPAEWITARNLINADRAPGKALLLPWAAYRRFAWNNGEAVLDPWPRLLRRVVIWNDSVQVGPIAVPAESQAARELGPLIASRAPMTAALASAGVRYVLIDAGWPAELSYRSMLPGCRLVFASGDLLVLRLPSRPTSAVTLSRADGR